MELGDIYPAVLTIVLIGIVLGLGIFIISEVRTKVLTSVTDTENLVAMNGTLGNNTYTLGNSTNAGYLLSGVTIINGTTANSILTTDYNWTTAGVITWGGFVATGGTGADSANISSTFIWDNADAGAAMTATNSGLGDFADWIAIIIIVIAAAIVLGIVFRSFGQGNPQA